MVKCVMNFFYSNLFVLDNVLLGIEAILGHYSGPSPASITKLWHSTKHLVRFFSPL